MSRRRRRVWLAFGVLSVIAAALLIPGSPAYLPEVLALESGYEGRSTRRWIKDLDSPDDQTRKKAIFAVGAIGSDAGDAVPRLAAIMLEDPSRECRIDAALALTKMPPASRAAIPQLIQALEDKEVFLRMNAAIALFRLKEEARPAVATLIRGIKDDENHTNLGGFTFTIQEIMTLALGRASAGTEEGVPTLIEILTQGATVELRRAAVRALGEVGPPSKPAAPHLRALLKSHNAETREAAAESLKRIGEPVELAEEGRARPDEFELPVPERKYLWQIEHHGNVLAKHGFGPFSTAVKAADPVALTRLLSDNFRGTEVQNPRRVRSTGFVEVERLQDAGHPPASLSRSAFVDRLLAFRRAFPSQPPNVKLALMGLSPKVRGDLDGPWQGTAQLRLYGEHAPGAPAEIVALLRYEIPRPTEEALAKPGWLRGAGVEQVLTAKAPRYLFADVARERGLDPDRLHDNWTGSRFQPGSGGAYVGDFNRDGILDILIADINGHFLYQGGTGGKFQDVTTAIGLPARPTARPYAAWLDIDGDGWDDLILGGRVYRNEAGARFTDYTDRCRLRLPTDTGGIVVADYDRDGKLDLYVTRNGRPGGNSWLAGHCDDPRGNTLFKNLGDWRFEDVTKAAGASGDRRSTFTAAWLDANDDGWPDLHVPNEFGDGVLLVNKGDGTFAPQPLADRPADFGTMGLAVGDVNNDGRIDIYCANMYSKAGTRVIGNLAPDAFPPPVMERMRRFVAGSQLHLNKGGTKFEQVGPKMQVAACGWAYGACLADLDNDGWLDVFGTAGYISQDRNKPDG